MNIKITKDETMPTHLTGGEFGISNLEIFIDPRLPIETQRMLVIHCIVENYCRSWSHDKVEQLCGFIEGALEELVP